MFGQQKPQSIDQVDFLLLPGFSMMAVAAALDTMRAANRIKESRLYSWRMLSVDGGPVGASNGVFFQADGDLNDMRSTQTLFVCSGIGVGDFDDKFVFSFLRRLAARGVLLGGICTGALILARAEVLAGHRCTIHWENIEAFAEEFPDLDITAMLYEIDRNRVTCSGGAAPIDMMLNSMAHDHGEDLAVRVSDFLLYSSVRRPGAHQRASAQHRLGVTHPKLLAAIARMEAQVENPLPLVEMASSVGLSTRQLERLFRDRLGTTPSRYHLEIRLNRARQLLHQASMSVMQVAVATGFSSASHFARCYREYFHKSPRADRSERSRM